MAMVPSVSLSDEGKLKVLQGLDQHRQWFSLDEKRYCIVCGKILTGRHIQIIGGTDETGPLRAACPTQYCGSIPIDWVRPTDEVLANQVASLSGGVEVQQPVSNQAG
jgi:hypothetical protein